jgi:endonuclease-3 related protein
MLMSAPSVQWMQQALTAAYGVQAEWWPAESPFEICIGAILVQNTAWQQAARGIANLRAAGALDPTAIVALTTGELEALLRPSGMYRQKTQRLQAFCQHLFTCWGGDLDAMLAQDAQPLRAELLGIWGIGEETADAITLFAAHRPAFIVDAYTMRIARRVGLVPEAGTRHDVRGIFVAALTPDVATMGEMHALLVTHAQQCCRAAPLCPGCPLAARCAYWKEHAA